MVKNKLIKNLILIFLWHFPLVSGNSRDGGNDKFTRASEDLIFCIKKKNSHPCFCFCFVFCFFLLLIFFSYVTFLKKWAQMVENCGQGETFVKGSWKFSNMIDELLILINRPYMMTNSKLHSDGFAVLSQILNGSIEIHSFCLG